MTSTTTTRYTNGAGSEAARFYHPSAEPGKILLHGGDYLFRMGDRLDGIYYLNAGAIKVYRITKCGEQQVIGFYMSGDVIGLDALDEGVSLSMAVAMDTTSVSRVSFDSVISGTDRFDGHELMRRVGVSIKRDRDLIMMLSQRTADRRLAWFLVDYHDRLREQGVSPSEFTLPMSRTDIAVYLGLAVETVCRELARFCELGLIGKDRRRLFLLDVDTLRQLASGDKEKTN